MTKDNKKTTARCHESMRGITKAFRNGTGRYRVNIDATDGQLAEWVENGWIALRKDQPATLRYYEIVY